MRAPADLFLRLSDPLFWIFVGLPMFGEPILGLGCRGTLLGEMCPGYDCMGDGTPLSFEFFVRTGDNLFLLSTSSRNSSFSAQSCKKIFQYFQKIESF